MANRGRPFQHGNQFGKGRPRGSRNKTTETAQVLLNSHAEPVIRKALLMALRGDSTIVRALLDRVVPVRREMPVAIGALPTRTLSDIAKASERVLSKSATGEITLGQAIGFTDLLEKRRKMIETEELAQRISALESKQ
jgi:hypothetical protein